MMDHSSPAGQRACELEFGNVLRSLRAFSLPMSVLPVWATAVVLMPPDQWSWGLLAAASVAVAALHLAGNLFNDYFDYRCGVDRILDDDDRPGRLLVDGKLLARDVLIEACLAAMIGIGIGTVLAWQAGWELLGFGAVGVAALWAYTGPPFHLKYRAMGEVTIFIAFGPALMLGAAWLLAGRFDGHVLAVSIPVGLSATAVLVGGNYRDRLEDAAGGIKTLGTVMHGQLARWGYVLLVAAAVLSLVVMAVAGWAPRWLAISPLTLALLRKPLVAMIKQQRLAAMDVLTARWVTVLMVLIILVYVL